MLTVVCQVGAGGPLLLLFSASSSWSWVLESQAIHHGSVETFKGTFFSLGALLKGTFVDAHRAEHDQRGSFAFGLKRIFCQTSTFQLELDTKMHFITIYIYLHWKQSHLNTLNFPGRGHLDPKCTPGFLFWSWNAIEQLLRDACHWKSQSGSFICFVWKPKSFYFLHWWCITAALKCSVIQKRMAPLVAKTVISVWMMND